MSIVKSFDIPFSVISFIPHQVVYSLPILYVTAVLLFLLHLKDETPSVGFPLEVELQVLF